MSDPCTCRWSDDGEPQNVEAAIDRKLAEEVARAVRMSVAHHDTKLERLARSDGEPCFGGGWFIVVAQLPSGQVSNHYREEHWDLFDVPAVDLPPPYDGHTPADAAGRLRAALAALEGVCADCGHAEGDHDGYGGVCDGDMDPETGTVCGCAEFRASRR